MIYSKKQTPAFWAGVGMITWIIKSCELAWLFDSRCTANAKRRVRQSFETRLEDFAAAIVAFAVSAVLDFFECVFDRFECVFVIFQKTEAKFLVEIFASDVGHMDRHTSLITAGFAMTL